MPRDLESEKATIEGMIPLSKDKDHDTELSSSPEYYDPMPLYRLPPTMLEDRFRRLKELHPYTLLLSQEDADDCDWLEHVSFDPIEAATREKIEYRLHRSGDLCSGIFTSARTTSPGKLGDIVRSRKFSHADAADPDRKRVLLGHVIATKHAGNLVTDPSMDYPKDWRTKYELSPSDGTGHDEDGRTVCLHSLCVHPDFQDKGLGRVLLVSWIQRIRDSGVADRIALICREKYIKFYEGCGFKNEGASKCQYGGGGWYDMLIDFKDGPMGEDE